MQISNSDQTYSFYNHIDKNTQAALPSKGSFGDHLKTQSSAYKVDISTSLGYATEISVSTDYFQSSGRAMKNQTSFDENWENPDKTGDVIIRKGVYIDSVPDDEVKRDKFGRTYLEQIPEEYYKNMSFEDKELFKKIMSDSHMSYGEVDSLSFEQVKQFNPFNASSYLMQQGYSDDEILLPSVDWRVSEFISATELTRDDTFNRAVFKTVKEATNVTRDQISKSMSELTSNMMQLGFNKPFGGEFTGSQERPYLLEKYNLNINYDELLAKGISFYGQEALSSQASKSITEEYKLFHEWYFALRENYNEVKDKQD